MILCLAAAHASKSGREEFFCDIGMFLPANIFSNILFDSPSFINTILENHSFK